MPVATTGTTLLGNNPNRLYLFVQNEDSSNFAKLNLGRRLTASSQSGIRLDAAGGAYEQFRSVYAGGIGTKICSPVFAVADTAQVTLSVVSYERRGRGGRRAGRAQGA